MFTVNGDRSLMFHVKHDRAYLRGGVSKTVVLSPFIRFGRPSLYLPLTNPGWIKRLGFGWIAFSERIQAAYGPSHGRSFDHKTVLGVCQTPWSSRLIPPRRYMVAEQLGVVSRCDVFCRKAALKFHVKQRAFRRKGTSRASGVCYGPQLHYTPTGNRG